MAGYLDRLVDRVDHLLPGRLLRGRGLLEQPLPGAGELVLEEPALLEPPGEEALAAGVGEINGDVLAPRLQVGDDRRFPRAGCLWDGRRTPHAPASCASGM